jgi:TonB family protein
MITRNEKAKGLWWRLLATLPVLAILLIANTKVSAKEMKADEGDSTLSTVVRSSTDGDNTIYDVNSTQPDNDSIYEICEVMPEFPGGEQALMKFVSSNVHYPEEAKDKGIEGRVFVSFVVEKDGSVTEVEVRKGIGKLCDEEAARVVKAMPKWKPGMQNGKPVRVHYNLPFFFKLTEKEPANTK